MEIYTAAQSLENQVWLLWSMFSIPRLEFTAATLSEKKSKILKEELDIHITSESFWTGSQVDLGYVNNKVFVTNRVQFIRDHTDVQQ